MITLQRKSTWSSNSWLKRQAVTAWSECTFISKITIGYLQVSWNNSCEKWGRQQSFERGQGAHAVSHLGLAEQRFALQISSAFSFHLPTLGWISLLTNKSCCYNPLLIAALSAWSCTALFDCFLLLPLPARLRFWSWSLGSCGAGGCLGQPCSPDPSGVLLLLSSSSMLSKSSSCFLPSQALGSGPQVTLWD